MYVCQQMEISRYLRQHARTIAGKSQLFINSYAKALEVGFFFLCFLCNIAWLAAWLLVLGFSLHLFCRISISVFHFTLWTLYDTYCLNCGWNYRFSWYLLVFMLLVEMIVPIVTIGVVIQCLWVILYKL